MQSRYLNFLLCALQKRKLGEKSQVVGTVELQLFVCQLKFQKDVVVARIHLPHLINEMMKINNETDKKKIKLCKIARAKWDYVIS